VNEHRAVVPSAETPDNAMNENERWYLSLTSLWAARLRSGSAAGLNRPAGPDVRFAVEALGLRPGARVLDLACAWGRTTIELARQGYDVIGFDISPDLLAIARERAIAAGLAITFVEGTVRRLPDLGSFDAVTAFYDNSVLSFEHARDNVGALRRVAAALRAGGGFLFGTTDCPLVIALYQRAERAENGVRIVEEITFDAATLMGTSVRTHELRNGETQVFRRTRRHHTLDEAAALLSTAGLELRGAWCAYDQTLPYGSRPEGMVVQASKPDGRSDQSW
jgi:2-polyprenyl-3-methyl-5-hydroxy-6-metoxy-1,4-benzoquinol methylase